jgi:hypothetical protein
MNMDAIRRALPKPAGQGRRPVLLMRPDVGEIVCDVVLERRTLTDIARRCGIDTTTLQRFRDTYITEDVRRVVMVQDKLAAKQFEAGVLNEDRVEIDGDLRWVIQKLKALLQDAEGDEDRLLQLGSLREIRQSLLALAELQGKLNKELTVHLNLNESPQFLTLREIILRVLDRHPEAKADFLDEMRVLKVLP